MDYGTYLITTVQCSSIYYSVDGGLNWTIFNVDTGLVWNGVAARGDGMVTIAQVNNCYPYMESPLPVGELPFVVVSPNIRVQVYVSITQYNQTLALVQSSLEILVGQMKTVLSIRPGPSLSSGDGIMGVSMYSEGTIQVMYLFSP
jgi:hypothetical protein